uniref:Uncharacterized protein n=1 Tax=Desertifilum tharense IPPAS B-1220 TaxID=1781255 RepID=A0ACD5GY91_9CYAN
MGVGEEGENLITINSAHCYAPKKRVGNTELRTFFSLPTRNTVARKQACILKLSRSKLVQMTL